ncbi:MAG TPA: YXWGXW repeat-containing protein [Candidatus Aquilonibacter sp.]|nr:YXWGXW repeat-containing protein [Candidatus Aquilonibacter sp.]
MQIKRAFGHTARNLIAAAALAGTAVVLAPAPQAHAAVFLSVAVAPPVIPVYAQPLCPGDGYIWTPGYWAWGPDGYYWVDGAWVLAPYDGALWTPGWWGFDAGFYYWHPGYWGRTVGYYGGINYGYGYFGTGFYGGYWNGGHFFYNRAYGHFGPGFHGNFYNRTYAGFSGRPGGASFNAHPPAAFAHDAGGFRSTVHGAEFHNNAAVANHGAEGFRGNEGSANRGNFNGAQPSYNHQAPRYNGAARGSFNGGAAPRYNAPSGRGYRGGSAPAPHYSAPSGGGGNHSGGGSASHSSGGEHR